MAVELPTSPGPARAVIRYIDFGADQVPVLGGPAQRLERLGSRHAVDFTMPPMEYTEAMAWVQRLKRGKRDRVLMEFPQPGLLVGSPGAPKVRTATASGTTLPLKGLTAGYEIVEGQFFSVVHSARRYLYSANADVTANGSGNADVAITPMLRTSVAVDDVVEIEDPMIEGMLSGNELGWEVDVAHFAGLGFTVTEAE